jgi:putative oxidoreductase
MSDALPLQLTAVSAGLLALRLVLGLGMAAHGSQKLFGWFGGHGIAGTGGFFEMLGFRPGRLFAIAAGTTEFASGLLIALGFLGPIGPALMLSVMIVAALTVHWKNGYFAQANGVELTLMFAVGAVALAFTGFGDFSLDAVTGLTTYFSPAETIGALVLGVVGAVGNLAMRKPQPAVASQS